MILDAIAHDLASRLPPGWCHRWEGTPPYWTIGEHGQIPKALLALAEDLLKLTLFGVAHIDIDGLPCREDRYVRLELADPGSLDLLDAELAAAGVPLSVGESPDGGKVTGDG